MNKKIKILTAISILVILLFIVSLIQGCCPIFRIINEAQDSTSSDAGISVDNIEKPGEQIIDHGVFSGIPQNFRIGSVKIPGQAIDVDISGNYAYLTNDLGVLYIINITDKEKPFIFGKCPDIDSANIVIVRDDYAFVSYTEWLAGDSGYYTECGFKIVDISNKEDPRVIADYNTGDDNRKSVFGLYIEENHAYLNTTIYQEGSEYSSMEIVNISDPADPFFESSISIEGSPSNVWVTGERAYLNTNYYDYDENEYTGLSKFIIIDVSDKNKPLLVSSTDVPSSSWGIYVNNNNAYLSSNTSNEEDEYEDSILQIIDISNEKEPELAGSVILPGGAWEIDKAGDFINVSDLTGGIYTIDISDDNNPFIAGRLNTSGTSYDITIEGNHGYIADGFEGLVIAGLSKEDGSYSPFLSSNGNNIPPKAIIDIFGDKVGGYYITGSPIVFSGLNSFDPEGAPIKYHWNIDGNTFLDEDVFEYIFEQPGNYMILLEIDDGNIIDEYSVNIMVADTNLPIHNTVLHNFSVEIEYILTNNGPVELKDIECLMRTPFSYEPHQKINSINTNIPIFEEIYDNHWNKLYKFDIEQSLLPGESLSVKSVIDVSMFEYDYGQVNPEAIYDIDDPDLRIYTGEDLFIDSDNSAIEDTTKRLIGDETRPLKIAEILYNYITRNLYYDYDRAENREYEFMNASEILEAGKGVCSDYSILYTAMLRSAGIPARLAAGIPVYTILYEPDREIDVGHAWVEIKIPGYGWVPVDITTEEVFWSSNYFLDITTERGPGYIYEHSTMDWGSYYFDGFDYSWEGQDVPDVNQDFIFRVRELELGDILKD